MYLTNVFNRCGRGSRWKAVNTGFRMSQSRMIRKPGKSTRTVTRLWRISKVSHSFSDKLKSQRLVTNREKDMPASSWRPPPFWRYHLRVIRYSQEANSYYSSQEANGYYCSERSWIISTNEFCFRGDVFLKKTPKKKTAPNLLKISETWKRFEEESAAVKININCAVKETQFRRIENCCEFATNFRTWKRFDKEYIYIYIYPPASWFIEVRCSPGPWLLPRSLPPHQVHGVAAAATKQCRWARRKAVDTSVSMVGFVVAHAARRLLNPHVCWE